MCAISSIAGNTSKQLTSPLKPRPTRQRRTDDSSQWHFLLQSATSTTVLAALLFPLLSVTVCLCPPTLDNHSLVSPSTRPIPPRGWVDHRAAHRCFATHCPSRHQLWQVCVAYRTSKGSQRSTSWAILPEFIIEVPCDFYSIRTTMRWHPANIKVIVGKNAFSFPYTVRWKIMKRNCGNCLNIKVQLYKQLYFNWELLCCMNLINQK